MPSGPRADTRGVLIEACTWAIDGDYLDAEAAVAVMSADERADLVNALDDLRTLIDRAEASS